MANLPDKLSHIGAKVFRSITHLESLDHEIKAFLSGEPYEIISEFNVNERTYTYRAKPRQDIPLHIRVLTGEVLAQLRSTLDHLAWQLALLNGPNPAPNTEFPIFTDDAAYTQQRQRKIGSLPPSAQTIIDGLQPYLNSAPEDDSLYVLHRLANDDKHRLPHLVTGAPQMLGCSGPKDVRVSIRMGPFEDETEIGKITILNPRESDVTVDPTFSFNLAFPVDSAAKGQFVLPQLVGSGKRVEEVIRKFTSFF